MHVRLDPMTTMERKPADYNYPSVMNSQQLKNLPGFLMPQELVATKTFLASDLQYAADENKRC